MSNLIEIGKIVNTRGLKGELKIYPYVDELSLFSDIKEIIICDKTYTVSNTKYFKNMVFLTLSGIDTKEKAELLRNELCFIKEENLPVTKENEYYIKDIEGLAVRTDDGRDLGKVISVIRTGSNDCYEVKNDEKTMYIPAIKDVIKDIDIADKVITVHLIDGLEDL